MIRAALCLSLAAGMAAAQDLPEGYPPVMGDVSTTLGDRALSWQTYDFSVGAFDASAWMHAEGSGFELRIMAYLPHQPRRMKDRIFIRAQFAALPEAGAAAQSVAVSIMAGDNLDGPRLTSEGQPATLEITGFTRKNDESYGAGSGTFRTVLCKTRGSSARIGKKCQPFEGTFDTELQFENM